MYSILTFNFRVLQETILNRKHSKPHSKPQLLMVLRMNVNFKAELFNMVVTGCRWVSSYRNVVSISKF